VILRKALAAFFILSFSFNFFLMMKPCQAPLNKAPNKGERKNKERRPKSQPEEQIKSGSQKGKGTNYVPKPLPIIKIISKKGRET
jgi:hypothetical protein